MQTFELFTLNYKNFRPTMGTPVQTSNGRPRWKLPYDLTLKCQEVYPAWKLVKSNLDKAAFTEQYHAGLDAVGVDVLASRFRALATAGGDERLVLLCFEDIAKSVDDWCHRRMFADWWEDRTGEAVRELGPTEPGQTPPQLF